MDCAERRKKNNKRKNSKMHKRRASRSAHPRAKVEKVHIISGLRVSGHQTRARRERVNDFGDMSLIYVMSLICR